MTVFFKPSKKALAAKVSKGLAAAGLAQQLRYSEAEFCIYGEGDRRFYLGHLYAEYCAAPFLKRQKVLDRFVAAFTQTSTDLPDTFAEVKAHILPCVRSRAAQATTALAVAESGHKYPDIPQKVMGQHFVVYPVYDGPDSIRSLSQDELARWNLTLDQALAVAKDNMWHISNERFHTLMPGTYASPWRDNHDASRIFMYDLIWQLEVKGRHVAAAPSRDDLIVTGSEDADGLAAMVRITREVLQSTPRPVSGMLLVLEDREWRPFMPPEGHPAHDDCRRLMLDVLASDYTDQKACLDKLNEKRGADVFVPNVNIMTKQDTGLVQSVTTWAADVESLLPETDVIGLVGAGSTKLLLGDSLRTAAADYMKLEEDFYPPRYRVKDHPPAEVLNRVRQMQ